MDSENQISQHSTARASFEIYQGPSQLLKHRHYTHDHWTTAKAFSSEEYFILYWKEIGISVAALSVPTRFRGLHDRAH